MGSGRAGQSNALFGPWCLREDLFRNRFGATPSSLTSLGGNAFSGLCAETAQQMSCFLNQEPANQNTGSRADSGPVRDRQEPQQNPLSNTGSQRAVSL